MHGTMGIKLENVTMSERNQLKRSPITPFLKCPELGQFIGIENRLVDSMQDDC